MSEHLIISSDKKVMDADGLIDGSWHDAANKAYKRRDHSIELPVWLFWLISALILTVLWVFASRMLAGIASVITVIIMLLRAIPSTRPSLDRFFVVLASYVGVGVGWILLVPIYFVIFPSARILARLSGRDELQLRSSDAVTNWLSCDGFHRKDRNARRMFATVSLDRRGGIKGFLITGTVATLILFLSAELYMRYQCYHDPLLYVNDAKVYYLPRANQRVKPQRGGDVVINNYHMRRTLDVSPSKPSGIFRVLLLGDSTLFGGEYHTNQETYAAQLELLLNREMLLDRKVEVLPMGVNSWGAHQKLGYIEKFGTFGADLVIICMPIGDVYRASYGLEHVPYASRKPTLASEMVLLNLSWRYRNRLQLPGGWNDIGGITYFEQGLEAYNKLSSKIHESVGEYWYELLPQGYDGLKGQASQKTTDEIAMLRSSQPDTRIFYPVEVFVGKGDAVGIYHSKTDMAHLGRLGHRLYAEYLDRQIRDKSSSFQNFIAR